MACAQGGFGAGCAVALLPSMPFWAFGAMVVGGVWVCLWTSKVRLLGIVPFAIGAVVAALAPSPDLLVTGDGRHLAVIRSGTPLILRDRAGDYVRSLLAEASGFDGDPDLLADDPQSDCSRDSCLALIHRVGRDWRLFATRSAMRIDWQPMTAHLRYFRYRRLGSPPAARLCSALAKAGS